MRTSRMLFPSLSAAAIAGWLGGAVAWGLVSGWTDLTPLLSSYDRLDQLVALTFGACSGACVLTVRARHRREPLMPACGAGLLLGAVAALVGATVGLSMGTGDTPMGFVFRRMATWALMAAFASVALSTFTRTRQVVASAESLGLGALGGVVAGALFSLPGPAELWFPLAITWCGAAIGFATVGPALWRAPVVVQVLASRDRRNSLWSLHERAIENGWSTEIAEARIGCVDGVVYVYPPPAGAILDGSPLYRAMPLTRQAIVAVGRIRCRVTLGRRE